MKRFALLSFLISLSAAVVAQSSTPMFTTDIALGENGELVMSQKGRSTLDLYSPSGDQLIKSITLSQPPTGVAVAGGVAYVTTFKSEGKVEVVSLSSGEVTNTIAVGSGACAPALSQDGALLYICNQYEDSVAKIDTKSGQVLAVTKVDREPKGCVVSGDGKFLYVTNFLPNQRADLDYVASNVSIVSIDPFVKVKDVQLANGSNAVRGICLSHDGRYVYVSHNLGRYTVPTSQLQQGWMNTSAFSVIDTESQECLGALIVDEPERGAAGIWDIASDDTYIYISHSGTHEISIVDQTAMLDKLLKYPNKSALDYDLRFMYGIRRRVKIEGNGPRSIVAREGEVVVPTYFADVLNLIDVKSGKVSSISLNANREASDAQRGEMYFNDATLCFQSWQSCNGCHPGDGRTDGMNWDLMNDGVGNSKNCKSMLYSHLTPPSMISGIRATAELAVRKGFTHIQFFNVEEEYAVCVDEYLKGLEAVPSPRLVNGELSELAEQGRKVFNKLKCNDCHSGPYFTDMKSYRIGEDIEFEQGWDTPTLREVWRTAPYLFDGRAATMEEVFSVHKHGVEKSLSKGDLKALVEYVMSL